MKILLIMSVFLSTSMTSVPEQFVDSHRCVPKVGVSCVVDIRYSCPPGYFDGCITNETEVHLCLPDENGPSCDLNMNLQCPLNFEDGCLSGESDTHLCLPQKGSLCTEGSEFSCPAGFEDPC